VSLIAGGQTKSATIEIRPDPRSPASPEDLRKEFDLASRISLRITDLHRAVNEIRDLRAQMLVPRKRAGDGASAAPLLASADAVEKKMAPIEQDLIQVKLQSTEGTLAFPTMLNEQLYYLGNVVESADAAPAKSIDDSFDQFSRRLDADLARWKEVVDRDVPALNDAARKANLSWVAVGGG
jgi:hypothetical protein